MIVVDPETGVVMRDSAAVDEPLARFIGAADAAADTLRALERTNMELAIVERLIEDLIAEKFPQLKEMRRFQKNLQTAYSEAESALRAAAVEAWESFPAGASKSLLGGAVTIREAQRVTHYDPAGAIDWCQECAPDLLKIEANKSGIEKRLKAGAEVPAQIMQVTTVIETAINGGALVAWGE